MTSMVGTVDLLNSYYNSELLSCDWVIKRYKRILLMQ